MIDVSVIVVAYRAKAQLKRCLASLPTSTKLETIVVDNSRQNRGFAKGVNWGAKLAKGKYLFILNPDCQVKAGAINELRERLVQNPEVGIAGPELLNEHQEAYLSVTRQPTKASAWVVYSLINRWWPMNRYSRSYWYRDVKLTRECQVESLSGAALMVRRAEFLAMGGFDERFFLYWEDYDLSRRYLKAGKQLWFVPQAKVIHLGHGTTNLNDDRIKGYFYRSRWQFFRKHEGLIYALGLQTWLRLQEEWKIVGIMLLAGILRFWRLPELMPFIGDQARDFLAAKVGWEQGQLPLIGMPSSVPRFAQGPLYVWWLMFLMSLGLKDPRWAGYVAAVTGWVVVYLSYRLISRWLGREAGWLTGLILATSPLAVAQARLAFMTNPVPLFSLLYLWALRRPYRQIRDSLLVGLSFGLLFQWELATAPLALLLVGYGWYWRRRLKPSLKNWLSMAAGVALGLIPQLVFDVTHRGQQLGWFGVWLGYRLVAFLGWGEEHQVSLATITRYGDRIGLYLSRFMAWGYPGVVAGLGVIGLAAVWLFISRCQDRGNRRLLIIASWLLVLMAGFLVHGAPSEAYFPALFVPLAAWLAYGATRLTGRWRQAAIGWVVVTAGLNAYFCLNREMMMTTPANTARGLVLPYGHPLAKLRLMADQILTFSQGEAIDLQWIGEEASVPHFSDNLSYLVSLGGGRFDSKGQPIWLTYTLVNDQPRMATTTAVVIDGLYILKPE
ncbi:hypothetical protein A2W24_04820 [Microgenomates group bacterium RBG_16_45_19]|nr:MAG: hypothetical protein A2W24_04820 [Microgenomates group bacterium RBG_16_45_19]